jgi:hypothetical protein
VRVHRFIICSAIAAIFALSACGQSIDRNQAPSSLPATFDAKQQNLLYVGSGTTISMYAYADGNVGKLVNSFHVPASAGELCIDKQQRVYVPYRLERRGYIERYEHGATTPDLSYHFQQGAPVGCSYDNDNQRLGILDRGYHFYYWNVIVMPGRYKYAAPGPSVNAIAYNNDGTLFLLGIPYQSYTSQLVEIPRGDRLPIAVSIAGGTIVAPGPLAWGNPNLLLIDEEYKDGSNPGVYQVSVNGTNGKIVGGFALSSTSYASSIVKDSDKLIVADDKKGAVEIYNFPSGSLYATFKPSSGATSAVVSQGR